jgi:hypothetical protein
MLLLRTHFGNIIIFVRKDCSASLFMLLACCSFCQKSLQCIISYATGICKMKYLMGCKKHFGYIMHSFFSRFISMGCYSFFS